MRVAFIGAGGVNFGTLVDPWDHATRVEVLSQKIPLEVVAIYDVKEEQATKVLNIRQSKQIPQATIWKNTQVFTNLVEMLDKAKPEAVFIGIPPVAHGDVEIECAKRGVHMFIEKPISCLSVDHVKNILAEITKNPKIIVSVGYMLRYSKAVNYIKDYLKSHNIRPVSVHARYNTAYESILSPVWWDRRLSGGPIIEQATHFCDLARYLCGEIKLGTVVSYTVPAASELGQLSRVPSHCDKNIPDEFRVPRATQIIWKFENGALGTLSHGALAVGSRYNTQFEIWADGCSILLHDPYTKDCYVTINDKTEKFEVDDPYLEEDEIFLEAVRNVDKESNEYKNKIKSQYDDSIKTYELTWTIAQNNTI